MKNATWIVGHDVDGNEFMIRAEFPRFIAEIIDDDDGERVENVEWIDSVDGFAPSALAALMMKCGKALLEIDAADEARMMEDLEDE